MTTAPAALAPAARAVDAAARAAAPSPSPRSTNGPNCSPASTAATWCPRTPSSA
ncbi:hypothetical protein ACFQ2B_31855 [Streptomyces stramineus]